MAVAQALFQSTGDAGREGGVPEQIVTCSGCQSATKAHFETAIQKREIIAREEQQAEDKAIKSPQCGSRIHCSIVAQTAPIGSHFIYFFFELEQL